MGHTKVVRSKHTVGENQVLSGTYNTWKTKELKEQDWLKGAVLQSCDTRQVKGLGPFKACMVTLQPLFEDQIETENQHKLIK